MRRLLLIPLLSGCAGVAVFIVGSLAVEHGAMKVSDNYAYTDYRASPQATWNALTAELEARGIKYEVNKAEQRLTANGYTAEAVKHPKDPDYTRIQVKVGLFGKQKEKHSKKTSRNDPSGHLC